jgi:hypothetical protein
MGSHTPLSAGQYNNASITAIKTVTQTSNPTGENVILWEIVNTKVYAVYDDGGEVLLAEQTDEAKVWFVIEDYAWDDNGNWVPVISEKRDSKTTHQLELQGHLWFIA